MFDDPRLLVGLLALFVACLAVGHASYVVRHLTQSPANRDITQPAPDFGWRTTRQLYVSIATLAVLAALSVFAFTVGAKRMVEWNGLLPSILTTAGGWAIVTVIRGGSTGRIEPIVRGIQSSFERETKPYRYWASMGWNGVFGLACLGMAWSTGPADSGYALQRDCRDAESAASLQDALSACNALIDDHDGSHTGLASLLSSRGTVYYRMQNYARASTDYLRAIDLDPALASAHFNLGLTYNRLDDREQAFNHFDAAIRNGSENGAAFIERGVHHLDNGDFDLALADFTRAHELLPESPWPLANRGLTYAWKRDEVRASRDLDAAVAIDPLNQVALRGRALLSLNRGDREEAVEYLDVALKRDPNDTWSRNLRFQLLPQTSADGSLNPPQSRTATDRPPGR